MKPRYAPGEAKPGEFGEKRAEGNFTFEQKLEHVKAARQIKIEKIEKAKRRKLKPAEKNAITLTLAEYDEFRDGKNSLAATTLAQQHGWNYTLEKAGIPHNSKPAENSPPLPRPKQL